MASVTSRPPDEPDLARVALESTALPLRMHISSSVKSFSKPGTYFVGLWLGRDGIEALGHIKHAVTFDIIESEETS